MESKYWLIKKQFLILLLLLIPFINRLQAQQLQQEDAACFSKGSLNLRANAVSWLMLTPNVGLEYKATDNLGLLIEGGWSHWKLNTKNKYWRIWNVAPQARYYLGNLKKSYMGAQYTMGEYNLTGDQGKYLGGGLTLGHHFFLRKNLMADIGLSLGYLYLYDKEKYERIDGHNYRTSAKKSHGYWGPTGLTASFVWIIN